MLYRHVFVKISTEFRRISRIYQNFAAPRLREISEALSNGTYLKAMQFLKVGIKEEMT